ncbi:acyltransferase domain-containing protein [Fodinicola acaciae]|uniref:acyltransferase domain-containing protein n=1 Tax=Fodinicola acaciae TaxID=2681555 RepID=UPI0013D4F67F|nr:acyltransferase domain-containing protein [Fodinicola acaciae]
MPDPRNALGFPPEANDWLDSLEKLPPTVVDLPDLATADQRLRDLGVRDDDLADILAARPAAAELLWLHERCHAQLVDGIDGGPGMLPWQALPESYGATGRFFYVWVFLSAVPEIRRWHAEKGVTEDESREILADVGRQIAVHRRIFGGTSGLHTHRWLTLHFRGLIFSFGRLQFERQRSWIAVPDEFEVGDRVLSVHIPESGPMTPAACDASFAAAKAFYERVFPEEKYAHAVCLSWLMDTQLADALPAESNIVRFQRRFTGTGHRRDGDDAVLEFIFRYQGKDLDSLPQDTALQRAIVSHLRAGNHWYAVTAWCSL